MWLIIFILSFSLSAQASVDSLKTVLVTAEGREKVDILNSLSDATYGLSALNYKGDADQGIAYAVEASALAEKLSYTRGLATALVNEGYLLHLTGKTEEGFEKLDTSLSLYDNKKDRLTGLAYLYISRCHNRLGRKEKSFETMKESFRLLRGIDEYEDATYVANNIGWKYWKISQFDSALVYYDDALELAGITGDMGDKSKITNNIGVIYYQTGYYEKALEYFFMSLKLFEAQGKKSGIALTTISIGKAYNDLGKTDEALIYLQDGLAIGREIKHNYSIAYALNNLGAVYEVTGDFDAAREYYQNSLASYREQGDAMGISQTLNDLGNLYTLMGDYSTANELLLEALEKSTEIGNMENQAAAYYHLGNNYRKTHDNDQALASYLKSLELSGKIGKRDLMMNTYFQLSELYNEQGRSAKARETLKHHFALKDSIRDEQVLLKSNLLKLSYESEKKELENRVLRQENAQHQRIIYRNNIIILMFGAFLLTTVLLVVMLFFMYRDKNIALAKIQTFSRELEVKNTALRQEIEERRKAESKVKILSGFIPICASCKKIRDDEGYWTQIEQYIRDHSEADFSHGICPDCMAKLYPEMADKERAKRTRNHGWH